MRLEQQAASSAQVQMPPALQGLPWNLWEFVHAVPFTIDNYAFDFDSHPYLPDVYRAVTFDRAVHPDRFDLVLMTGAQVGKTWVALSALTLASLKFYGGRFGYFLPDEQMSVIFSSTRYKPMILSNPFLASYWGEGGGGKKLSAEDRKRVRTLGRTTIFFSYMGGKTSTEAIPMNGVFFDEVRQMTEAGIYLAKQRYAHSPYPIDVKISTAKFPGVTIDRYFRETVQNVWHSDCRCKDGIDLAFHWPDCIGERKGHIFYRCPRCDKRIDRPQAGRYRPRTPEHRIPGFHIAQILSPNKTAAMLWQDWLTVTDRQEFYNSVLGLPWLDPTTILVPESVARTCVNPALRWVRTGAHCIMGVDQRPNEIHVVVGQRAGSKLALQHLEIIQGDDPFARLYPLMEQFDVDCCVMDALPQYNPAVQFAKTFKRRVFLAYYSPHVHMIRWSDRDQELQALIKTEKDAKFEFHVMLDRYKMLEYALMQWVLRHVACPPPEALTQDVRVKGLQRVSQICLGNLDTGEQGLFLHLRSVARRKVDKQRRDSKAKETFATGEFEMVWENIGVDPHFLHAFAYCATAAARRPSTSELWIPDGGGTTATTPEEVRAQRPERTPQQAGDQAQFNARLAPTLPGREVRSGTCGGCARLDADQVTCLFHGFRVKPSMPRCDDGYVEKEPIP